MEIFTPYGAFGLGIKIKTKFYQFHSYIILHINEIYKKLSSTFTTNQTLIIKSLLTQDIK